VNNELVIFSGNAHRKLAEGICRHLGVELGDALVSHFSDGESRIELMKNIRGADVFIVQPTSPSVNQHLMEALIIADACRRASAGHITLVAPYFGYARQDRKTASRTPITAKLIADMIETAGFQRVLTLELHTPAIQGFFNIPVDHLFAKKIFTEYFRHRKDLIVVSPDAGGVSRARALAKPLQCGLAIIDKRRVSPNESAVMHIIGEVRGKSCLVLDDIIDTGGSFVKSAKALIEAGAKFVYGAITHPVLSGSAIEQLKSAPIEKLVVTDSIPLQPHAQVLDKIHVESISELLAVAIDRIHNAESISSLFD